MNWLIASDIHGSARWAEELVKRFDESGADRLLLLGDILYHGPRNALPEDYDPPKVAALFNTRAERICCVRGNCDSEVDQMVLSFPITACFLIISISWLICSSGRSMPSFFSSVPTGSLLKEASRSPWLSK